MFIYTYKSFRVPLRSGGFDVAAFPTPNDDTRHEISAWCYQMFGDPGIGERWIDGIRYGEILFSDTADLALFILRWS